MRRDHCDNMSTLTPIIRFAMSTLSSGGGGGGDDDDDDDEEEEEEEEEEEDRMRIG